MKNSESGNRQLNSKGGGGYAGLRVQGMTFHMKLLLKPALMLAASVCTSQGSAVTMTFQHSALWGLQYVKDNRATTLAVMSSWSLFSVNMQVWKRVKAVPGFSRRELMLVSGNGDSEPCLLGLSYMLRLFSSVQEVWQGKLWRYLGLLIAFKRGCRADREHDFLHLFETN